MTDVTLRGLALATALTLTSAACADRGSAAEDPPPPRPTSWTVIDGAEPHIDARTFSLTRDAESSLSPVDPTVRPLLTIRCTPDNYTAWMMFPAEYAPSQRGWTPVSYRIDSANARTARWFSVVMGRRATLGPDMEAGYFDEEVVTFVRHIRPGRVLTLTFTPKHRDPKTVTFKLDSLSLLLDRAAKQCGRPLSPRR